MLEYTVYLARTVVAAMLVFFMLFVNRDSFVYPSYRRSHICVAVVAFLEFLMYLWGTVRIANGVYSFDVHWVWGLLYYAEWTLFGYCALSLVGSRRRYGWILPLLIYYVIVDGKAYRKKVDDMYSGERNVQLHELSYSSLSLYFTYLVLTLAEFSIVGSHMLDALFVFLSTVAVVWLSIRVLNKKPNAFEYEMENRLSGVGETSSGPEVRDESPVDTNRMEARLVAWTERPDKPFCQESLSLVSVAEAIRVSPRALSSYLNTVKTMNFNSWINYLRVEEVKRIIAENPSVDVLDLMMGAGFQSRSSLSRAVKSVTGLTVTELKERAS